MKFEYLVFEYHGENTKNGLVTFPTENVVAILNEHGKSDWELVQIEASPHKMRFFFKREV